MSGSNGGETQQANTVCISGERLLSVCFYSLNVKVGTEEKPLTYLKERKKNSLFSDKILHVWQLKL